MPYPQRREHTLMVRTLATDPLRPRRLGSGEITARGHVTGDYSVVGYALSRNGLPLPGLYVWNRAGRARDAQVAAQLAAIRAKAQRRRGGDGVR